MLATRRRAGLRGVILFVALAAPVVAVAVYLFTRAPHEPPPPPREQDQLETDLRAAGRRATRA
jgi:hypothetical protein